MQTDNRLLDDLSRLATGALGTLQGAKQEVEALVRQRLERMLADLDLVSREEFEAVKAMAAAAREENDRLAARVAKLEKALAAGRAAPTRKRAGRGGAAKKKPGEAQ